MWWEAIPIVGDVLKGIIGLVDEVVEDKDEANKLKAQLSTVFASADLTKFTALLKAQAAIVLAEAKGGWLQRNWRPLLMLTVIFIIFNNYVLVPYLSMFTSKVAVLELPGGLWALLNVGVGGYVVGRSAEKVADKLRGKL